MTIEQVSAQSGVSAAVISKLERNQTVAGLDTLYRIGRAFGMSAADLLSLAESLGRKRRRPPPRAFRQIRYANARVMEGRATAGARISRPEIHSDDFELCWVMEGQLRIRLPHESCVLGKGESLQFDAILEHTYEALSDCRIILLHLRKDKRY